MTRGGRKSDSYRKREDDSGRGLGDYTDEKSHWLETLFSLNPREREKGFPFEKSESIRRGKVGSARMPTKEIRLEGKRTTRRDTGGRAVRKKF